MKSGTDSNRTGRYSWWILASVILTLVSAIGLSRFGFTMLLAPMQEGLNLSTVQAGDLATGNMVGYLAFSIFVGFLASRVGPKVVITVSLLLICFSMLLTGVAGSYGTAFAGRVVTGFGSAGANIPAMGLLAAWFSSRRRGLAAGMAVSGSSLGLVVSGLLTPFLLVRGGESGWRYTWFAFAFITFIIAFFGIIVIKNSPRDLAATNGYIRKSSSVGDSVEYPRFSHLLTILHNRKVWYIAVIYVLYGFSYIIYATFFAEHLITDFAFSVKSAGNLWSVLGITSIGSGLIWGMVSDRWGRKYGLAFVFFLQGCAFLLFSGIVFGKSNTALYVSAFLFALTAWSIPAIMSAAAGDFVGPSFAPAAFGFITIFLGLGQVFGPLIGGRVAEAAGSFAPALLIASGAALLGAFLSLLIKPVTTGHAKR